MKVNSISGLTYYVKDLSKTSKFYEALGFRRGKEKEDRVTYYVNWFFVTFIAQDSVDDAALRREAESKAKGAGQFLCLKVDGAEAFYQAVRADGLKPDGEPQPGDVGKLEFTIRDPDGYKLLFFEK